MEDPKLNGLIDIYDIFKEIEVEMYLSAGTLLGATRDGDFIPWDWNISVCCKSEQFDQKLKRFCELLLSKDFRFKITRKGQYICIKARKNSIVYIIENLILINGWRTRPYNKWLDKFLNKTDYKKIQGIDFPCPHPAEKLCEWLYGENWRTPIKIGHRDDVITKRCRILRSDKLNNKIYRTGTKKDV